MTSHRYGLVLRQVGRLLGGGAVAALGTGQLLERFAVDRDEAAFEALVGQHGPMVLGTCRRMLSDPHDVDDAFQATFLVLARKAGSIRDADRLGPWLHGVARRVATRSRALSARRDARERSGGEEPAAEVPDPLERFELRAALDEELSRLPEKYRAPLVLCYLEGLTHDEAAEQLRWPVGTVRSRLAGGRDRLRTRLTRRGLAPSAAVPAILPHASIPQALLSTTVRVATSAGSAPAHVASLAKGALIAMMWNKLKVVAALGLMAGLTVGGAGALAQQGGQAKAVTPPPAREQVAKPAIQAGPFQEELDLAKKEVQRLQVQQELDLAKKEVQRLQAELQAAQSRFTMLLRQREKLRPGSANHADSAGAANKFDVAKPDTLPPAPLAPPAPKPPPTTPATDSLAPATDGSGPRGGTGGPPGKTAPPAANPPAPQPIVHTLQGDPPLFAVVSAGLDRVTIIDSATKDRATFRMPRGATEIIPIVGAGCVSLLIKGPAKVTRTAFYDIQDRRWYEYDLENPATEIHPLMGPTDVGPTGLWIKGPTITRLVVFDRRDKKWTTQDLREPAKGEVAPLVMSTTVTYRVGRFLYIYSAIAKKWSVLELKRADSGMQGFGGGLFSPTVDGNGRMMIPEGDLIHLYDAKTGEWTQIDAKDDK